MLKIRRPLGRLIFNMGIAIPGKTIFLIETAPCLLDTFINMKYITLPHTSLYIYIYIHLHTYSVTKASARVTIVSTPITGTVYIWKIPSIIAVKSNVTTFTQVLRFVVNMFFHCGRVAFTVVIHAHIKGVRQGLASTASLDARRAL